MSELTSLTFRVKPDNVDFIKNTIVQAIAACVVNWSDVDVVIKKHTKKNTYEQKQRYWKFLEIIAENAEVDGTRYANTTWHIYLRGKFLGFVETVLPDGTVKTDPVSTTTLTTKQMTEYQDKIEAWGAHNFNISFYYEG